MAFLTEFDDLAQTELSKLKTKGHRTPRRQDAKMGLAEKRQRRFYTVARCDCVTDTGKQSGKEKG